MANENIRCIIKCLTNFQDGNCTPSDVKRGEILDVSEDEFHKLSKSGPTHFELIDRKFLFPKKKEVPVSPIDPETPTVEEEAAEIAAAKEVVVRPATPEEERTEADYGEGQDENMQHGIENVVDWKPVGWYAAQLAREPASEEA